MIEGIPVALLNGIGVVGIVCLIGLLLWRAITVVPKDARLPRLVTGREATSYLERAEAAELANVDLVKQNSELMEMARLGTATFAALRQAADA